MSELTLLPEVSEFLKRQHGHFINGLPISGKGETFLTLLIQPLNRLSLKSKKGR